MGSLVSTFEQFSAITSPVLFKRWKYFFNKQSTLSTRFSPKPSSPSLLSKCSEKQWLVWPLSAYLPSMHTLYFKNVTVLTHTITDTKLQHQAPAMKSLHLLMGHQPLPMELLLPHPHPMENQPTKQLHLMELKKLLCQTSHQLSL